MVSKSDGKRTITWQDFGPFLSRLRRRRSLSQERLAALLDRHRITIWRLENGVEHPSAITLRDLARIEGLTEGEAHWLAVFSELRALPVREDRLIAEI